MEDNASSDKNEIQNKKTIYEKINFWSCIVALIMAVASCVINIVVEFAQVNIYVYLAFAIATCVIALPAVILMIISWVKLRKIKRTETKNDTNQK